MRLLSITILSGILLFGVLTLASPEQRIPSDGTCVSGGATATLTGEGASCLEAKADLENKLTPLISCPSGIVCNAEVLHTQECATSSSGYTSTGFIIYTCFTWGIIP